ncbi:MAG: hypothetical protein AB7G21_01505 [Dehalococcoidia bacterium]
MAAGLARQHEAARLPSPWWRDRALLAAFAGVAVLAALFLAPPVPRAGVASPPPVTIAVADLRGHALAIVDTARPGAARRIPLPGGPHEVVALPDGRLVVSLEQYAALAVVDVASGEVTRLAVGGIPHGLAVDATTLYVTDRSIDAVRRFALGTWAEHPPLAAGAMPHIVASSTDGTLLVANAGDDTLSVGGRALAVSHVPESVAVGAGGIVATAGSIGGTLHFFDASGAPVAEHELGGRPVRLQYDPDGRLLAAALSAEGAVALLDRPGGEVRRVTVGGVPDGLAFSPDGRWLYVGDMYGGDVAVVDVRTARLVQRFPAGRTAGALLVLPER